MLPSSLQRAARATLVAFLLTSGSAAAQATSASSAPDTLSRIKAAKQIEIAFSGDSLPFSYVADDNRPAGFSIDLCRRVIAGIGRSVGIPDLKANWRVGTAAERVAMVASGKVDLDCANTSATRTRMKDVDFSSLVFLDAGGVLAKANGPVQRVADLGGRKIGVLAGTTTERGLDAALKRAGVTAEVTRLRDGTEGVAMLESGSLDAFAGDKIKLVGLGAQARDPSALTLLADDLSYEPIAFALPRNDSSFRLAVNTALSQVYGSGEIDRIFQQWLGKLGRPSGLLAALYLVQIVPE